MFKITERFRYGSFFQTFNFRDQQARGRTSMLVSAILTSCISFLTTGIFYTSFLIANKIDLVKISIIGFIPLVANCFSIFSPLILERFEKRKHILSASRALYYTINILGVTLLPLFITNQTAVAVSFAVVVFVSHLINALFSGGYISWHLNFIPEHVRAYYFSYQQIFSVSISSVVLLFSSYCADSLSGTPDQTTVLYILRFAGYVLAMADVVILLLPKEYPYLKKAKTIKLKNVFALPFSNKKFLLTMGVVAMWSFTQHLTSSSLNYHLLENVGVKYTFISIIDASYALFLIFLAPFWRKIIGKWLWLKTFAFTAMLHMPTMILYSFAAPSNYVRIMLIVRLTQHFLGVGHNLVWANMPYVNMPAEDRTNYIVFHSLTSNVFGFVSMMLSTWFIAATQNMRLALFGYPYSSVQILLLLQGTGQFLTGLFVYRKLAALRPD